MADKYTFSDDASSPSRKPYAVTPTANTPLNPVPKALYIGTGGTVVLRGELANSDVTFTNVPNGTTIPVRALFVRNTSTASDIVALA